MDLEKKHGDIILDLVSAYKKSNKSFDDGCKLVEYLTRNKQGQHAELILDFGIKVAKDFPSSLQDHSFADKTEEFFYAAIELKHIDWAEVFLRAICSLHPQGVKTMRLMGMWYESKGEVMKAQEIYQELVESCPTDSQTVKRLISLYRNNDMVGDAIFVLNKYLLVNQSDEEGWLELCDIYLSRQNFVKAQFCLEEILAQNPQSYQNNIRYAEILYQVAIGNKNDLSQLELSRKYFSHALVLIDEPGQPQVSNNVARALWGLVRVCQVIDQNSSKKNDNQNQKIINLAKQRLTNIYKQFTNFDISSMQIIKD